MSTSVNLNVASMYSKLIWYPMKLLRKKHWLLILCLRINSAFSCTAVRKLENKKIITECVFDTM